MGLRGKDGKKLKRKNHQFLIKGWNIESLRGPFKDNQNELHNRKVVPLNKQEINKRLHLISLCICVEAEGEGSV